MTSLLITLLSVVLTGTVRNASTGEGIRNVVVSDGYTCTLTDESGRWSIEADSLARTITVSVPHNYNIPFGKDGRPVFYKYIGKENMDFVLTPRKTLPDKFTIIAVADAHLRDPMNFSRFSKESVRDIRKTASKVKREGPVIGISLGDQMWDVMDVAPEIKKHFGSIRKVPFFYCIGNHDHNNEGGKTEYAVTDFYVRNFGPTDYSFNIGNAHIVVMDDIQYTGTQKDGIKISYTTGLTDSQLNWLNEDLALVPDKGNKAIIFCCHSPLYGRFTHKDDVKALLGEFAEAHILSGHEHNLNNVRYNGIWEHNIQSIGGSWWYSNLSPNGSPLGYLVMNFKGPAMAWEYNKATNESENMQMRVYSGNDTYGPDTPNPVDEGIKRRDKVYSWPENLKGCFVARIWDGTCDWDVKFVQNGVETPMKMTETKFFDCASAAYMTAVHDAPFGGSSVYRPLVDSFWTIPAPCGDPAREKGWEIVATHREPSGEVRTYRCSHLMQDYTGFATGTRYIQ